MVEGVLELYLAVGQDVPKDSHTETAALSIALDRTANILQAKSLPMPEHLSVKFCNAGRDGNKSPSSLGSVHGASGSGVGIC